jgi:hypothetical protein
MKLLKFISLFLLFYMYGCMQNPPVVQDGNGSLELKAVWDKSLDSIPDLVPLPHAKVILSCQYGMSIYYTDSVGTLKLNHLPSAKYNISVKAPHPDYPTLILVGANRDVNIGTGLPGTQTIIAKTVPNTGIAINEIYCSGPVNNMFYFYDLFIELYNSSDSIKYVDGMQFMRVSANTPLSNPPGTKGPGADEYNDGRMWGVTYIYKFPGRPGEKNYPFYPKQFLVIAGDAIDHRKAVASSIDLSHADWEFFNQYMAAETDNPNVPNLTNLRPDNTTKFLISLSSDIVALASGVDTVWTDGIDIGTIIDAVQYRSNLNLPKTIDDRLDKGMVQSPPRYSGKSMQRKEPGMDSNDGYLDWDILSTPTPGRQ